jgi:hypothetical protein
MSTQALRMRWLREGVSKDCNCTKSSFTTPVMPSLLPFPCPRRAPPMASISSMKPMAPPSVRAYFRKRLKKERILRFVWPKYIDWNAEAETNRNGTWASLAMALATKVFPVPGGPSKSTPRRADPPMESRKV